MASDLVWESINSVYQPTVGIPQFCPRSYCGNPLSTNSATNLLWESLNSVLRAAVGIHQFCPPSCCGNPTILASKLLRESTVYSHTFSSTMSNAFMNLQRWKYWHKIFISSPLEPHVVAVCLGMHFSNFGHQKKKECERVWTTVGWI